MSPYLWNYLLTFQDDFFFIGAFLLIGLLACKLFIGIIEHKEE